MLFCRNGSGFDDAAANGSEVSTLSGLGRIADGNGFHKEAVSAQWSEQPSDGIPNSIGCRQPGATGRIPKSCKPLERDEPITHISEESHLDDRRTTYSRAWAAAEITHRIDLDTATKHLNCGAAQRVRNSENTATCLVRIRDVGPWLNTVSRPLPPFNPNSY